LKSKYAIIWKALHFPLRHWCSHATIRKALHVSSNLRSRSTRSTQVFFGERLFGSTASKSIRLVGSWIVLRLGSFVELPIGCCNRVKWLTSYRAETCECKYQSRTSTELALHSFCDFFERRGEKRIDVGTLLLFLFFFFRWRPMFSSCFCLILLAFLYLQVCVCANGRMDIFSHVIFFSSMVKEYVCRYRITKYLRHKKHVCRFPTWE
jgi:hypothetical protein